VGAAGLGWDIPLSYIFRDATVARRRPVNVPGANIQARHQLFLVLDGQRIDLVRNAANSAWVARRNAPQLEVRDAANGAMVMYDGEGRTHTFSAEGPGPGTRLINGNLFPLISIKSPGGNVVRFEYSFTFPALPGGGTGLAMNLTSVRYNVSPTTADCFKNRVSLEYDAPQVAPPGNPAPPPLALSMLGGTALVRVQRLQKISVLSSATCSTAPERLRQYTLTYSPDVDTQQPRLRSVTMSGQVGTAEANIEFPVATYTYGSATVDGHLRYRKTQSIALNHDLEVIFGVAHTKSQGNLTAQQFFDLNGDGRPDMIFTHPNNDVSIAYNTPAPNATTSFSLLGNDPFIPQGDPFNSRFNFPERRVTTSSVQDPDLYYSALEDGTSSTNDIFRQLLDVNGDGRLDVVDAQEPERWMVYLNVPAPGDGRRVSWVPRAISTAPLIQRLQEAGYEFLDPSLPLPLARTTTTHDSLFNQCWRWQQDGAGTFSWVPSIAGFSGPESNRCHLPQGMDQNAPDFGSQDLATKTITEWELKDINGDGYPDFVYNGSPVAANVGGNPPPMQPGIFEGQFRETQRGVIHDIIGSRDIKALINVAGVHLNPGYLGNIDPNLPPFTDAFSSPLTLEVGGFQGCGIGRWIDQVGTSGGTKVQICGFDDVNGDGLTDRLTFVVQSTPTNTILVGSAALGTGDMTAPFSAGATIRFPGPIAQVESTLVSLDGNGHFRPQACPTPIPPIPPNNDTLRPPQNTYPIQRTASLRDVNGDGIPDYISGDNHTESTVWSVFFGTGTGFSPPVPIDSPTFELSLERAGCFSFNRSGATIRGMYDIDGDGQPEVVGINVLDLVIDVFQLSAGGQRDITTFASAPMAGRLIKVDNGYGASTHISYRSAKEDPLTDHLLPFPEIVVAAVGTRNAAFANILSATQYAYGNARLIYDPAFDSFRFPGYQRSVEVHRSDAPGAIPTVLATITDRYGLVPADESMDSNALFRRYLKPGRTSDITVLSDSIVSSAWGLLNVNTATDSRRVAGMHYDWDTRLLPPGPTGNEFCLDMVFPYDFEASAAFPSDLDQCTQHGFAFESSQFTWRGNPGTAAPLDTDTTVASRSDARAIDDFGRLTSVVVLNDVARSDDDVCVDTTYATPNGTNQRVLAATASRTVSNCAAEGAAERMVFAHGTWQYDGLPLGHVASGFPTSHTVERRDESGRLFGRIREFDATFNPLGKPVSVVARREDGATRTVTTTYDHFQLAPESIATDASDLPTLRTDIERDPLTLLELSTTDANGTQRGTTYDGLGRVTQSTVTPPRGASGTVVAIAYRGFDGNDPEGRRIVRTVFTDPVDPATASGRSATTYFDEIGRERRTDIALGADYSDQLVRVADRIYDSFGRVVFEADPYPSTQDPATVYGTTRLFNADGTPSCVIRGNGPQRLTTTTDEASELFPTCYQRTFQDHTEVITVQDPASLLAGSPQAGVIKTSYATATGRVIARATWRGTDRLEYATFGQDRLGRLNRITRFQQPAAGTNPVPTSWHFDSLGRLIELQEPDSVSQSRMYSDWGELIEMTRSVAPGDPGDGRPGIRRVVQRYDALGRLVHREDQFNGETDPETVYDYFYDEAVQTAPQVTMTNVLGRLALATSPTGSVSLSYDDFGSINARVFTDNQGAMYVEKHTIHADGTPGGLDLFLPDTGYAQEHVDYDYDSAGRASGVKYRNEEIEHQDLFHASTIDALGRVRAAEYGRTTYTASYADVGRRLMNRTEVSSPSGSRLTSFESYDPIGRERSRREVKDRSAAGFTTHFTYDALGRLSSATRTSDVATVFDQQFTYDPLGNLTALTNVGGSSENNTSFRYHLIDRDRICRINHGDDDSNICNVNYDDIGNVVFQETSVGVREYTYLIDGKTRTIADREGAFAHFRYDAFGQVQELELRSTLSRDTRHDRHYGSLLAWRDETTGAVTTSFLTRKIPGPGGSAATRRGAGGPWVFAFGEARGARFFTDETGAFVQEVEYAPFGKPTSTGAEPNSRLYSSEQWNGGDALAAFGVSQLGARIYDPAIGRFLSRDPLLISRTAATTNPYAFAMNDPVNGRDPSGLDGEVCDPQENGGGTCDAVNKPLDLTKLPGFLPEFIVVTSTAPRPNTEFDVRNDTAGSESPGFWGSMLHSATGGDLRNAVSEISSAVAVDYRNGGKTRQLVEGAEDWAAHKIQIHLAPQSLGDCVEAAIDDLTFLLMGAFPPADAALVPVEAFVQRRLAQSALREAEQVVAAATERAVVNSQVAASKTGTALARELGKAGEAGIVKNTTHIPSLSGTAKYRIPDTLNKEARVLGEVKNVKYLPYTRQLRDFAAYAEQQGFRFQLTVRQGTQLSGPLQREVDAGKIILERTLP
jgi:RHS repeat-associated protein